MAAPTPHPAPPRTQLTGRIGYPVHSHGGLGVPVRISPAHRTARSPRPERRADGRRFGSRLQPAAAPAAPVSAPATAPDPRRSPSRARPPAQHRPQGYLASGQPRSSPSRRPCRPRWLGLVLSALLWTSPGAGRGWHCSQRTTVSAYAWIEGLENRLVARGFTGKLWRNIYAVGSPF